MKCVLASLLRRSLQTGLNNLYWAASKMTAVTLYSVNLSQFEILLNPLGPHLSFLGTSLLAVTPTFGEAHVIATKQDFFL